MTASDIALNVIFYVLAAAAIGGAVAVAASKNIVRSAFALLAVLFSAAALYAVMKADFIAAAQVLIYVGGILVLIIFAVMLTHRITDVKLSNDSTPGPAAFCACLCLLFSLVVVILFTAKWQREPESVTVRAEGNWWVSPSGAMPRTGLPSCPTNAPASADARLTETCWPRIARTPSSNGSSAPGTRSPRRSRTSGASSGSRER